MQSQSKKIQQDFLKAREKTTITIMRGLGWKEGIMNPESIGCPSIFFYVLHQKTDWVMSFSVPRDNFFKLLDLMKEERKTNKKYKDEKEYMQATINMTAKTISDLAKKGDFTDDDLEALGCMLGLYISQTQTYKVSEQATKANHFVVMNYVTETLRPFAMKGSDKHLIEAKEVQAMMKHVIDLDRKNHPEWFKG